MSRRTLQRRSGLIRLMRLPFGCGAPYCCDPLGSVLQHRFGAATPDRSEIADQPVLAKFGVVIHCYPTHMEVIQRAPAEAAG
jgi:hypothetical protein